MNDGNLFAAGSWEGHRGPLSLVFVVAVGLGVSMIRWPAPELAKAGVLGLGLVYLVLGTKVFDSVLNRSLSLQLLHFTCQLFLAFLIFLLFAQHGSLRSSWLILMPLIAQARLALPRWLAFLVAACSLLMMAGLVFAIGGWRSLPSFVGGMSAAIVFVLIFTEVAMDEAKARQESERLGEELAKANQRLAAYTLEVEELATARERTRLAREIHDSLGHYLTVVNVQLEAALAVLDQAPERARAAIDTARSLTREGLGEVRRSVAALRSSPLENRPLTEALGRLGESSSEAGVHVRTKILGTPRPLPPPVELTLFRAVQEGLTNVRKHAATDSAMVVLDYRSDKTVSLEVQDEGAGSNEMAGGFGLLGVEERVRQLEGRINVRSELGAGLTLTLEVPG